MPQRLMTLQGSTTETRPVFARWRQNPAVLRKAVPQPHHATSSAHQHWWHPLPPQNLAPCCFIYFARFIFTQARSLISLAVWPSQGWVSQPQRRWDCPFTSRMCLGLVDVLLWWLQAFAEETIPERAQRKRDVAAIYFPVLTIVKSCDILFFYDSWLKNILYKYMMCKWKF